MSAHIIIAPYAASLTQSRPGSQYDKHRLPGRMRRHHAAQFELAGLLARASRFCRWPSFSRRQAVGVVAYLNTGTLTAVQFLGPFVAARRLFSDALLQACKQSCSRVADRFHVLSCALFVHDKQRIRKAMSWVTSVMLRVARCL